MFPLTLEIPLFNCRGDPARLHRFHEMMLQRSPPLRLLSYSNPTPKGAPGIMRRSPLIDALHPEVARQREFQLQLRQARQQEIPPGSSKREGERTKEAAELTSGAAAANIREGGKTANHATGICSLTGAGRTNVVRGFNGAGARNGHAATTATTTATTAAAAPVLSATIGAVKARNPRRSRCSETAPLPVPPSPATKFFRPRPLHLETGASSDGSTPSAFADDANAVAQAGTLSALQVNTAVRDCGSLRGWRLGTR